MALVLTIPAVTIGGQTIPERTFTEGIDFEIGSMLQEGEQAFREEMVAIIPGGNNSQAFRDYAQRIGAQRVLLAIDVPAASAVRTPKPVAPEQLERDELSPTSLQISWEEVSDATVYEVIVTTDEDPPDASDRGTVVAMAPPTVPVNLVASARTTTGFTLTWGESLDATGYDLYISTSSTAPVSGTAPTASVGTVTTYTATGLEQNTTYNVYLRAKNAAGNGDWSSAIIVTTSVQVPPVPASFRRTARVVRANDISFTLSWDTAARATSYEIYWSRTTTPPTAQTAASRTQTTTTYSDTQALGATWHYWVRARNRAGASAWSSRVTVLRST